MQRLLLLSNSRNTGGGWLDHVEPLIRDLIGTAPKKILFVPFAAVTITYDAYVAMARKRFAQMGYAVTGAHKTTSALLLSELPPEARAALRCSGRGERARAGAAPPVRVHRPEAPALRVRSASGVAGGVVPNRRAAAHRGARPGLILFVQTFGDGTCSPPITAICLKRMGTVVARSHEPEWIGSARWLDFPRIKIAWFFRRRLTLHSLSVP